jgi:hypothetical protein
MDDAEYGRRRADLLARLVNLPLSKRQEVYDREMLALDAQRAIEHLGATVVGRVDVEFNVPDVDEINPEPPVARGTRPRRESLAMGFKGIMVASILWELTVGLIGAFFGSAFHEGGAHGGQGWHHR